MQIDICVLTAGARPDLLRRCLDAIPLDVKANVYLLNNGGPDRQTNPGIVHPILTKVKRLPVNKGFPAGANAAIEMGKSDLVLFLSDDVVIQPNTIQFLIETMKDEKIGLCGLKLVFPYDSTDPSRPAGKVQHVGHSVDLHGQIHHIFIGWSADNPKTCRSGEVFSVTGAAFMVRRKLFQKVGGFDEVYGLGTWEDIDLALKIRSLGYKIYLDANAVAEHVVGATAEQLRQPFPLSRNQQIFMSRWRDSGLYYWDGWIRW